MSSRQVKASRRQIRKAFGPDAMAALADVRLHLAAVESAFHALHAQFAALRRDVLSRLEAAEKIQGLHG